MTADAAYHLLFAGRSCAANTPAVIVQSGAASIDCLRCSTGSANYILSVGVLDVNPGVSGNNVESQVTSISTASSGLGEALSSVTILVGTKTFSFGDMTLGPVITHPPRHIDFVSARNMMRTVWMSGTPFGVFTFQGVSTDGTNLNYVVQYFNTQGIANPYSQFDAANRDLVPAMLEMLYNYPIFNNLCSRNLNLKTTLGSTVMTASVSSC